MPANKPEVPKQVFDPKDKSVLVYEVFPKRKQVVYHVRGSQATSFAEITLDGYDELPAGLYLYRRGFGFGRKGTFLLSAIKSLVAKGNAARLVISKDGGKSVTGTATQTITLPYDDVHNLLVRLSRINEDANNELRQECAKFLRARFPHRVKEGAGGYDDYTGGEIASVLRRKNVAKKLNEEDLAGLKDLIPQVFESSLKGKSRGVKTQRAALVKNTKKVTDRIFLDDVIREFEALLKKPGTAEEKWQRFLKEKVFPFLANYVTTIDKQNVSIEVSYPDFVLVDVYGFIDVFEIKRAGTELLAFDQSHENYYWKPQIAQAIAQIENYIDAVIQSAPEYIKAVKRKKRVDIKVVRPRGYIVAGSSTQFRSDKESEDFRKLSLSLRNISFILYDDLLARLKNLRAQL